MKANLLTAAGRAARGRSLLRSALTYAVRGWLVFPVFEIMDSGRCACPRAGCDSGGKHPRTFHGPKDAITSEEQIRRWWSRWPNANVAISTGSESGLVVLDVDPRHDGMRSLEEVEHVLGGFLPESPTVITGGGGTHTYFTAPDDGKPVPSVSSMLPGLDVKADGGYVVAPPSIHISGQRYTWNPWLPRETPLAPMPDALLGWLRQKDEPPARAERRNANRGPRGRELAAVLRIPKVRRRFERDSAGLHDISPSGIDYALACMLAACGGGFDEIQLVIEASRRRAELPSKRPSYYRATIGKALRLSGAA